MLTGRRARHNIRPLFMNSYAKNVLVLIKVKLMECWVDSAWLCIFHFWKCVTQGIKSPFENKAADPFHLSWVSPCHSFLLFPSFSLSVLFSGWLLGTQEFYWLSVLIKEDQALLFTSLSLSPKPSSWGYPWILLGLDTGSQQFHMLMRVVLWPGQGHMLQFGD